jgi:phospholipase C
VQKIVNQVEVSPTYTKDTVILITEDEGGGYYDSGYVQPVDFFGDGTRIPLIVVANPQYLPLRYAGYISHRCAIEFGTHMANLWTREALCQLPVASGPVASGNLRWMYLFSFECAG